MVGSKCRDFKNREVSNVNAPIGDFCARIIPPWDLHVPFWPFACIIGSPAILFLAILLHNVCFILHLSLHKWCKEKNTGKTAKIESQNTFVCERVSEWFLEFLNSFAVKKVNFLTINVKFEVILSSKSGGDVCTGHPPTQKCGGGGIHPPIPTPPPPPRDLRQWSRVNTIHTEFLLRYECQLHCGWRQLCKKKNACGSFLCFF